MTPTRKNRLTVSILGKLRKEGIPESSIENVEEDSVESLSEFLFPDKPSQGKKPTLGKRRIIRSASSSEV